MRNLPKATCVPANFAETLGKEIQVFPFSTVNPLCFVQAFSLDQADVVSRETGEARRGLWCKSKGGWSSKADINNPRWFWQGVHIKILIPTTPSYKPKPLGSTHSRWGGGRKQTPLIRCEELCACIRKDSKAPWKLWHDLITVGQIWNEILSQFLVTGSFMVVVAFSTSSLPRGWYHHLLFQGSEEN